MESSARRRPTMADVARAAGVSRASVSIAFRDEVGVGEATKRHILAVAQELGYVRDEGARGLRAANSTTIGVCFDTRQPFQLDVVDGLYKAVAGTEYQLVLSGRSSHRDEREATDSLLAFRSGVLLLISPLASERELVALAERVPVVSLGRQIRATEITWVASDDQAGMNAALSHLTDLGHTDITYLSSETAPAGRDRLKAFRTAVAAHRLEGAARVQQGGMTEADGVAAAEAMLEAGPLPTAVIAFNDRCALGMMQVFLRAGVRVPEDVSVVGVDDSEVASNRPISMTSIRQDPQRLAELAVERALHILAPSGRRSLPRGTLLPTSLTIRETTGPARP